ncbi:MAG TPA: hypothetical protein VED40_18930 [Azospirillaceae bacterium]|nr:hypothetical protein [Azospirillaceae bacterium]
MRAARLPILAIAAALLPAGPALADAQRQMLACGEIRDDAARLKCFDSALPALRTLMQTPPPAPPAAPAPGVAAAPAAPAAPAPLTAEQRFGVGKTSEDVDQIVAVVEEIEMRSNGKALIRLANGQTWTLTEPAALSSRMVGRQVRISRKALGNFLMAYAEGPSLSWYVRRVN